MKIRRFILTAARVLFAAVALIVLLMMVDVREAAQSMSSADMSLVVMGVFMAVVAQVFASWRWMQLANVDTSILRFFQSLRRTFVGYLYGTVLPGQIAGDVVRTSMAIKGQKERAHLAASVLVDRLVGLFGLVTLGIIGALLSSSDTPVVDAVLFVFLALMFGGISFLVFWSRRVTERELDVESFAQKVDRVARRLFGAIGDFSRNRVALAKAFVMSLLVQGSLSLSAWLLAQSLGAGLSVATVAWVYAVVLVIQVIPITIAGLGTREGALIVMLGAVGVGRHDAFALSMLIFLANVVTAGIGAASEMLSWFGKGAQRRKRSQLVEASIDADFSSSSTR